MVNDNHESIQCQEIDGCKLCAHLRMHVSTHINISEVVARVPSIYYELLVVVIEEVYDNNSRRQMTRIIPLLINETFATRLIAIKLKVIATGCT